jgi:hypothetical protein
VKCEVCVCVCVRVERGGGADDLLGPTVVHRRRRPHRLTVGGSVLTALQPCVVPPPHALLMTVRHAQVDEVVVERVLQVRVVPVVMT